MKIQIYPAEQGFVYSSDADLTNSQTQVLEKLLSPLCDSILQGPEEKLVLTKKAPLTFVASTNQDKKVDSQSKFDYEHGEVPVGRVSIQSDIVQYCREALNEPEENSTLADSPVLRYVRPDSTESEPSIDLQDPVIDLSKEMPLEPVEEENSLQITEEESTEMQEKPAESEVEEVEEIIKLITIPKPGFENPETSAEPETVGMPQEAQDALEKDSEHPASRDTSFQTAKDGEADGSLNKEPFNPPKYAPLPSKEEEEDQPMEAPESLMASMASQTPEEAVMASVASQAFMSSRPSSVASEKPASEKPASEKPASEKAASEKAASEKAADLEEAPQELTPSEKDELIHKLTASIADLEANVAALTSDKLPEAAKEAETSEKCFQSARGEVESQPKKSKPQSAAVSPQKPPQKFTEPLPEKLVQGRILSISEAVPLNRDFSDEDDESEFSESHISGQVEPTTGEELRSEFRRHVSENSLKSAHISDVASEASFKSNHSERTILSQKMVSVGSSAGPKSVSSRSGRAIVKSQKLGSQVGSQVGSNQGSISKTASQTSVQLTTRYSKSGLPAIPEEADEILVSLHVKGSNLQIMLS